MRTMDEGPKDATLVSQSKETCIPAPVGGQLRELLDSYPSDVMSIHQDMLKTKHQVDILTQYHELSSVPSGLVFEQEMHIKDPPPPPPAPWFTRVIEKRVVMEKTSLLIQHWRGCQSPQGLEVIGNLSPMLH
ncbi:hypothetical protein EMCRGX_G010128 [Ephydatia muelleri]